MRRVEPAEILDLASYERVRARLRADVIALKERRRIVLGPELTLLFENRATVLFQIQEMLRAEGQADEAAIRAEIATYNELLPGPGELSATLFVEISDVVHLTPSQARKAVERFRGLDREALWLELGGRVLPARFEEPTAAEERVAAVRYLRFSVPEEARRTLDDPSQTAFLRLDHPACRASVALSGGTRAELLADLDGA